VHRLLFLLAALWAAAASAAGPAYLDELVARAKALQLAERPEWRKLVHYEPDLLGPGWHGLLDNASFYNSPAGKRDPQAELDATLAAFFSTEPDSKQCAFIARRTWLDEELKFDRARLPMQDCPRFREWHQALNAASLTLVFASAYINNPSSMYGHTLLRIDARDQNERTRLLAYAVNSAAATNEQNGITFAVQGLIGGYPGTFSVLPYYIKVREYSDLENRDLWEYQLALTPVEVERVVRHLWELLPAYYEYYFFDENCAYHLLGLLQVARPELELTRPFRWWALPSDTVRILAREPGLVANVVYRPANATLIAARLETMSKAERGIAKDLSQARPGARDALRNLPADQAAAALETAHDYLNYRRASGKAEVPDPAALARDLLVARSAVEAPSQAPRLKVPPRPDEGHGTSRIGFAAGRRDGQNFQELRFRATYHDIMDTDAGYVKGAEIQFFDTALRHYAEGGTRLERFVPVDILSLTPRDDFFQPRSWRVAGGWQRRFVQNGKEPLVAGLDGGAGATWESRGHRAMVYALAEAALQVHHELDNGYSIGAGARIGTLADPTPRWRINAYASGIKQFLGERDTPASFGVQNRVALGRDVALRIDFARTREADRRFNAGSLSLQVYF
jgi:hypothetical protein